MKSLDDINDNSEDEREEEDVDKKGDSSVNVNLSTLPAEASDSASPSEVYPLKPRSSVPYTRYHDVSLVVSFPTNSCFSFNIGVIKVRDPHSH
jgi:hypothetical protein